MALRPCVRVCDCPRAVSERHRAAPSSPLLILSVVGCGSGIREAVGRV